MKNKSSDIVTKIIDYFAVKHSRGILINGEDATLKSYFAVSTLIPELQKHEKLKRKNKRIKIIYVSLNNLEEYSQITHQILKQVKTIESEISKISFSFKHFFRIRAVHNKLKCIKKSIVIFHELEKCNININDMLSYIDKFSHRNSLKTIIIANEKNISKLYGSKNFGDRNLV